MRCEECTRGPHNVVAGAPLFALPKIGQGVPGASDLPDPAVLWARTVATARSLRGTTTLVMVLVVVGLLQSVTGGVVTGSVSRSLMFVGCRFLWGGYIMEGIPDGWITRIVTSGFATHSVVPLLLNLAVLALAGPVVERLLGWRRLVVLYLTSTVAASASMYLFDDALTNLTGAAAPGCAVLSAALALKLLTKDRRFARLLILAAAVYGLAMVFGGWEFRPYPIVGAVVVGLLCTAAYAYLPEMLARWLVVALWLVMGFLFVVRTVLWWLSDSYYEGLPGVLDSVGLLAVAGLLTAAAVALAIQRPTQDRLAHRMVAIEKAAIARTELNGEAPYSLRHAYAHEAAEWAILRDETPTPTGHKALRFVLCLGVVAAAFSAVLTANDIGTNGTSWTPAWLAAVTIGVALQGLLAAQWVTRSREHDDYRRLNGSNPTNTEQHVANRLRLSGVLVLVGLACTALVGVVCVASSSNLWANAVTSAVVLLSTWNVVRQAGGAETIRALLAASA